jgi:hypothetical protein
MAILTKQEALKLIRDKKSSPPKFAGGGASPCGLKVLPKKKK